MVSVEGSSLRDSIGGESEVRGYDDVVFDVSSNSYSLGSIFSSSSDLSAFEGSNDLLAFLIQLPMNTTKNMGESVATLVVTTVAEVRTSQRATS